MYPKNMKMIIPTNMKLGANKLFNLTFSQYV